MAVLGPRPRPEQLLLRQKRFRLLRFLHTAPGAGNVAGVCRTNGAGEIRDSLGVHDAAGPWLERYGLCQAPSFQCVTGWNSGKRISRGKIF